MNCPFCGEPNLVDTKFCAECGKPLSGDLPSYMYKEEPSLKEKLIEFGNELKKAVTEKNYKEILADNTNPITNMAIVLAAWLILRFVGLMPFRLILLILGFLISIPGAVVLLALTYVYTMHKDQIMGKVEEIKQVDYKKSLREIIEAIDRKIDRKPDVTSDTEEEEE